MNRIRNHSKELIVLTILLAVAVSVVNAAVFVYYPISISLAWGKRPIYFSTTNTNAGGPDITGTITVTLGDEDTSATISVNASRRGTTYYKDILRIINDDGKAYYIGFNVSDAITEGVVTEAKLILWKESSTGWNKLGEVDLRSTGSTWIPWTIEANGDTGDELRVDLRFKISSGTKGSDSASISLVYCPENESPP